MWTHDKDSATIYHVATSLPCVHVRLLSSDRERHL